MPKAGKGTRFIRNLRLIKLLTGLYKVMIECATHILKPGMDKIVKPWQMAYVPGSYIGKITRNIYEIFQYAMYTDKPGFLLSVDSSKAFISISY